MIINKDLQKYIENNIFPEYKKNDTGHDTDRVKKVIKRCFKFAKKIEGINIDMVYTIGAYHDIAHHINAKHHEKVSSDILLNDENLKQFFNAKEIKIMAEAVQDHRASSNSEPRSIYGKIIASADRVTKVEDALKMTYSYRLKHCPNDSLDTIIEDSRQHLIEKFGENGYSNKKMYFDDSEYKQFLVEITKLTKDKKKFRKQYIETNKIKEE